MRPQPTKRYPGIKELCPRCCKFVQFVFKTGPGLISYECEECGSDWREPRKLGRIRAKAQRELPA